MESSRNSSKLLTIIKKIQEEIENIENNLTDLKYLKIKELRELEYYFLIRDISNWKLVNINWKKDRYKFENEFEKLNNKWYFFIESDTYEFNKYLAKNNGNNIKQVNFWNWIIILNNGNYAYFNASEIKHVYRWDGNGEPEIPTVDNNGKIIDWK